MADYGLPTGSLLDEAPSGLDWSGPFWTAGQQLEEALSSLSSAADQLSSLYDSETYGPLHTQIPNYATTPSLSAGSTTRPYAANGGYSPAPSTKVMAHAPSDTTSITASHGPSEAASAPSSEKVHLGPKIIAAIAAGGALLLVVIGVLVWLLVRTRRARRRHSLPSSQGDLFEIDESLVVTPLPDMRHHTGQSSPFPSSSSNSAPPSMHQAPTGLTGIANNLPSAMNSTETLSKGPISHQPCDIYISDIDAGPAQVTPNVHVLPPQYDPQWTASTRAGRGDGKI